MAADMKLPERLSVYFHSEVEDGLAAGSIPVERGLPDIVRITGPAPTFATGTASPRRRRNARLRLQAPVRPLAISMYRVGRA